MRIMQNKKWISKIAALSILLILAGTAAFLLKNQGVKIQHDKTRIGQIVKKEGIQVSDQLTQVAENDSIRLLFNGTDCSFAIEDKITQHRWYSNPLADEMKDLKINDSSKKMLQSQLVIKTTNSIQQEIFMDSSTFSISLNQYTAEKIDHGVQVTYSFGYPQSDETYPRALSTKRFDEISNNLEYSADQAFLKKMYALIQWDQLDKEEQNTLVQRYSALDKMDIYILRDGQLNTANKKKLAALFSKIGYTKDQLSKDLKEVGYTQTNGSGESFTIPVKYVLDGDGFRVSIDCSKIRYTESDSGFIPLIEMNLLNYFGCTKQNEEGYFFIPDGSGALVDYNQKTNRNTTLEKYIYGNDKTILSNTKKTFTENFTMPVYGIKTKAGAMLAVIEDGDAMARIHVSTGSDGMPYNSVNVIFDTMNTDYIPIGETATKENFYVYSNDIYKGKFSVKYYFLNGENAGYEQMAAIYRENLISRGQIKKSLTEDSPSLILELQGAVDVTKTLMGIPYKSTMALTDFRDVTNIVSNLISNQIKNPVIHYTGIYQGGYKTTLQNQFKTDRSLGTADDLKKMMSSIKENNITLYAGADFYNVYKELFVGDFHKKTDAARNLAKEVFDNEGGYLVSPALYGEVMGKYVSRAAQYGIHALAPAEMGSILYSDYNPQNQILRQDTLKNLTESLSEIKKKNTQILSDGPNSYMFPYSSVLTDIPFEDSGYSIASQGVPFYQMVVHGLIDYCGKPVNYEAEPEDAVLESIATGSLLHFQLMAKEPYLLNDTDYSDLYAAGYHEWEDHMIEWVKKTQEAGAKIRTQKMTGYQVLEDGITLTTYENDQILVNRTGENYTYQGTEVKAKSYSIVSGGTQK